MLKRWMCLLLTLTLLAGLPAVMAAEDAPLSRDIAPPENSWINSVALYQGALYAAGDSIYRLPANADAFEMVQQMRNAAWAEKYEGVYSLALVADNEQLYGLDTNSKKLYTLTVGDEGVTLDEGVALDLSPLSEQMGDDSYVQQPAQMVIAGGRLYVIGNTWGQRGPEAKLFSYDLKAGGEPTVYTSEFVQQLAPYKEGKLLALQMDTGNAYDQASGQMKAPTLAVWDPASDSLEPLPAKLDMPWRYEGAGMAYDAAQDYIYLSMGTEVYRIDAQGESQPCAYLNPTNVGGEFSGRLTLLPGGRLAAANQEGIALRSGDPADLPAERLTIYGSYMDDTHKRAMARMAGTSITFLDSKHFATAQQLGQALVGGEDSIDIFVLRSEQLDLNSLMQKGYTADLSGSQIISEYVKGLYPAMAEVGAYEGKTMLVPVSLDAQMSSYYPKLLEQVGEELPTTFDGWLDFLQRWNDELGEQYPDILPSHSPDYKAEMMTLALRLYAGDAAASGKPFSFEDPALRRMLERVAQLRTEDIAEKVDWSQPGADMGEIYNKAPLTESWYSLDLRNLNELFNERSGGYSIIYGNSGPTFEVGQPWPFALSTAEDAPARVPVTLSLMAVNPRSKHLDSAITYVESYLQSMDLSAQAMLNPSMNDPIPNPDADRQNKWMEDYEKSLQEAVDKAEGAEKAELETQLETAKKDNAAQREQNRWLAKAEAIQMYRDLMENAYIQRWGDLNMVLSTQDMLQLLTRYAQGQTPLDQFLQEAEGKLRLMRLEAE